MCSCPSPSFRWPRRWARVDRTVLAASEGLGASPLYTFRKVYAPLIAPGIGAAATLVFLSPGLLHHPALLGGQGGTTVPMLIEQLITEQLNWQMASAVSFILLGPDAGHPRRDAARLPGR